jgi:mRNA-degrading endonuclease RelE of RelBE toxin-antitoxin system
LNYTAIFLRVFLRRLRRLHPRLRLQVRCRVLELVEDPYLGLRLVGELQGFWKDRVGKYHLIYKIDETKKEIVFYDVDLRKRVYR